MSKIKKFFTFVMAIAILVFFNITAFCENASTSGVYWYTFSGPSMKILYENYDTSERSFALAKVSNLGEDAISDLEIATQAYNLDFLANPTSNTTTVETWARVEVVLNDNTIRYIEDSFWSGDRGRFSRVRLFGRNLVENGQYIISFSSSHRVATESWREDETGRLQCYYNYYGTYVIESNP